MTPRPPQLPTGRGWVAISAPSLDAIPPIPGNNEAFVLFVAADARGVTDEALRESLTPLLKAGARCASFWGPDCRRMHDACDLAAIGLGLNEGDAVVMTSWHDNEPLKEAIWFAGNSMFPDEAYSLADNALVAIAVGSPAWHAEMTEYLEAGTPLEDEA